MQNELFNDKIIELENGNMTAYVLSSREMFYDIGFRVMKNQDKGCLIPCHKLKYNGKIKLAYFTGEYVSLQKVIAELEPEHIGAVIQNLAAAFEEVRNNGFLSMECIDNRLERIFVEVNTYAVRLIYLPLNATYTGGKGAIETELRAQLVKLMQDIRLADNPRIKSLVELLQDGRTSFSEISRRLHTTRPVQESQHVIRREQEVCREQEIYKEQVAFREQAGYLEQTCGQPVEAKPVAATQLRLEAVNGSCCIAISGSEFVIGKSRERADGVIEGNPAISRVHCKIVQQGKCYYIVDMKSANGTFVDHQRIEPERPVEIHDGTKVKMANMEFIVRR